MGTVVVDCDDGADLATFQKLFGVGPVVIESGKKGFHLPSKTSVPLKSICLRRFGLEGEIKGSRSFVVAPGSIHPESGRPYRFVKGGWGDFANLPEFNHAALKALIGRSLDEPEVIRRASKNPNGLRNNSLFAHLRGVAASGLFASLDDVLFEGLKYNQAQHEEPEEERKVVATCRQVWRYLEEGRCRAPRGQHFAVLTEIEFARLETCGKRYADALALYFKLKRTWTLHVREGGTFPIATSTMAEKEIVTGWRDRKRYLAAKDALLACGLLKCVKRGGQRAGAAQYIFSGGLAHDRG
jgi:hypothetical protein